MWHSSDRWYVSLVTRTLSHFPKTDLPSSMAELESISDTAAPCDRTFLTTSLVSQVPGGRERPSISHSQARLLHRDDCFIHEKTTQMGKSPGPAPGTERMLLFTFWYYLKLQPWAYAIFLTKTGLSLVSNWGFFIMLLERSNRAFRGKYITVPSILCLKQILQDLGK